MTVKKCKYEDILAISEIEKACFSGEGWAYGTLASAFENPAYCLLVAEDGGEIVGFICGSVAMESCDLENVVVCEGYRKSGVGTALVEGFLQEVKSRGAEKVFLEVRVSNTPALRLYLACGFKGVYARTRYYSDGEDCLVMSRSLSVGL